MLTSPSFLCAATLASLDKTTPHGGLGDVGGPDTVAVAARTRYGAVVLAVGVTTKCAVRRVPMSPTANTVRSPAGSPTVV